MKLIHTISVYAQSGTHGRFNIEPLCSDVCVNHRRPQTLAEICKNMGICCGFRAVAARENYPEFILFQTYNLKTYDKEWLLGHSL